MVQAAYDSDPDDRRDRIFSDVVMPGTDEFGRRARGQRPATPLVLNSGYSHVLAEDKQHHFPLSRE